MKGFSVFLGEEPDEIFEHRLTAMLEGGFDRVFTSLHIPEEDSSRYKARLSRLGAWTKKHDVSLYADISEDALEKMALTFQNTDVLKELGLTGLRMDYGIDTSLIAKVSQSMKVALNASTLTKETLDELKACGAKIDHLIAWHNYYPRPETGLGKKSFIAKNEWLKKEGFHIAAFVPGDGELRGPLFEQLPTLEKHRGSHPLADMIELHTECSVDDVYVGDPALDEKTMSQFKVFEQEQRLLLFAENIRSSAGRIEGMHTNRPDGARDVFRSSQGRLENTDIILPENAVERPKGSITLDNELYGRYQGELQITLKDLPKNEKVNVVGSIRKKDLPLLDRIRSGQEVLIEDLNKKRRNESNS